ncbi:MAG: metal-dependent hydrolase [Magnetococcales bacterium]|nr:metal-dependent hydrolase [Magnetococcales bacterium]
MDPVSHALLGATVAAVGQPRARVRVAALVGGVAALLVDLDVLIQSESDPLLQLEYHRQFTHALLFTPVGALLATLLLWWWTRTRITFRQSWGMACWGYLTAGPLDACTSYGTQLLWPFTETRFAWSIIPVVEPVATMMLMVALYRGVRSEQRGWLVAGLVGIALWFGGAAWQQQRATVLALEWAQARGHQVAGLHVKPTMMNLLLWRAVYKNGHEIQSVAVRPGWWDVSRIYPGATAPWLDVEKPLPGIPQQSRLAEDIRRFSALSGEFVVVHPQRPDWFGDGRYAMLPHTMAPLWGIVVDPAHPERPAPFDNFRFWPSGTLSVFLEMVLGRTLAG